MKEMSDNNRVGDLILPLCINVGAILLPVAYVQEKLDDLSAKRDAITTKIEQADPDEASSLEKLRRDLASVEAQIEPLDDSMEARLGHMRSRIADSA